MYTQGFCFILILHQKCGHASYDDCTEFPGREGTVVDLAKELMQAGYINRAQIAIQPLGTKLWVSGRLQNGINLISRKLSKLRKTPLPTFVKASPPKNPVCLPADGCRWLHLCMKKKPYATHLKPLHVCEDENQDPLTDETFFKALEHKDVEGLGDSEVEENRVYRSCPDVYVDHIKTNDLPLTANEYDFAPPPPPKMVQNTCCIFSKTAVRFLMSIRISISNEFPAGRSNRSHLMQIELHFVEGFNTSLAITYAYTLLGLRNSTCYLLNHTGERYSRSI
ncbi:uncharacterized protein EAF01_006996 [Botrytis porri]|uniref:uncharacterized protein n=1 Tax=Botrytis porri TaxID=87229 RepID=UPI0019011C21|nr:uncharacterized protein EAF01_006996 [Botrytis porri]KAF7901697.1 hypothetical protein EAF01_006996 [Botrytis porri]